ncbi:MAG TPA: low temperature requirement protein A, partial [Micromonosporaceae bacterium]
VFGMWWLYFDRPGQDALTTATSGFVWGYGHYLVFASAAAVGAGIVANVDMDENLGQLSTRGAAYAIAIPVSIYLLSVWWLHSRPAYANEGQRTVKAWALPVGALLILLAPLVPAALPVVAAIVVLLVVVKTVA